MAEINCYCGKPKKENRQKYCSQRCAALLRWSDPEIREKYVLGMKNNRRTRQEVICKCGISFMALHPERRKYCSLKCKYKYSPKIIPSNFKGEDVGYDALHDWVNLHLGKATYCFFNKKHKANVYHWANKSHEYKRDLEDYISLCVKCHRKYDKEFIGSKERRFEHV